MNVSLQHRLDEIYPRITSKEFLSSEGIGNEIAFYIFDYPAEDELHVREHIELLVKRLGSHHKGLKVLHLNLFDVVIEYLEKRKLLHKAKEMQQAKGDAALLKALKGPLAAERIRGFIAQEYAPHELDLLLLSGVGSVWPMLRAHNLLNCLHTVMEQTPLVMFYPGRYNGTALHLFGQANSGRSNPKTSSYYRAFILVPGGNDA